MGTNSMEDLVEGIKGTKNSLQVSLPSSDPVAEKQNREIDSHLLQKEYVQRKSHLRCRH